MKKYLFFALALLMTACEKIILDEDISGKKDANVILHFTQFGQEAFSRAGSVCGNSISAPAATRAATDITELCSRLNIAIFDADGTKVKTVAEGDYPILLTAMKLTESDIRNFYTADEIETTVTVCYDLTTRINKAGNGASSKDTEVYDLAGRKVEKPVQKGVYIVGGHKLLKR